MSRREYGLYALIGALGMVGSIVLSVIAPGAPVWYSALLTLMFAVAGVVCGLAGGAWLALVQRDRDHRRPS